MLSNKALYKDMTVPDLNGSVRFHPLINHKEGGYVHRHDDIFPVDAESPLASFLSHRSALSRRLQGQDFPLLRPLSRYGFCSTDLPREPARYRSLPPLEALQVISYGHPLDRLPQQPVQCQRATRLEDICRVCSDLDQSSSAPLRRRRHWGGPGRHCLCPRFLDDRSLPFYVSLGSIPSEQGGNKVTYPAQSPQRHSQIYPDMRWKTARRQRP